MPWPSRAFASTVPVTELREQQAVLARQLARLHDRAVRQRHLGSGGEVEPGLHDAVVAQRDAEAGLRAEQAPLADADALRATTGQGAHGRGAATDVRAVAHDHALADPALHHRGAEGAGVEVDEALVHHGGAGREVGAEAHPVGVADPDPGGHDVVDHARELVDAEDLHGPAGARAGPGELEALDGAGTPGGPHDVGEDAEDPVEVEGVRGGETVESRCRRRYASGASAGAVSEVDRGGHQLAADLADLVLADQGLQLGGAEASAASGPSTGSGYQVSRTTPSSVMVASPIPDAVRSLMGASLGEADDRPENGWWIGWRA